MSYLRKKNGKNINLILKWVIIVKLNVDCYLLILNTVII